MLINKKEAKQKAKHLAQGLGVKLKYAIEA